MFQFKLNKYSTNLEIDNSILLDIIQFFLTLLAFGF